MALDDLDSDGSGGLLEGAGSSVGWAVSRVRVGSTICAGAVSVAAVPRSYGGLKTEQEALRIVREEEVARGWTPGPNLSKKQERREGCDFFSVPPDGGPPCPVEVKGWGDPLISADGRFADDADINEEQYVRADRDPTWRLEIVGNLTAARAGTGDVQRLTLTAAEVIGRARPWRYRVTLAGLRIRR